MRDRLSTWFRGRRDVRLRELILQLASKGEPIRILDLGGRAAYWRRLGYDFLRANNVRVDLLNLTAAELGADAEKSGLIESLIGDACALPMADGSYDLCHSNSVIEHVGSDDDIARFAAETRRVGRALFVQTPNVRFPVDPHFWRFPMLHWLPRSWRIKLLQILPLSDRGKRIPDPAMAARLVDGVRMLNRRQFTRLFPDARIYTEWFLFLPKSFIAVRTAPSLATDNP